MAKHIQNWMMNNFWDSTMNDIYSWMISKSSNCTWPIIRTILSLTFVITYCSNYEHCWNLYISDLQKGSFWGCSAEGMTQPEKKWKKKSWTIDWVREVENNTRQDYWLWLPFSSYRADPNAEMTKSALISVVCSGSSIHLPVSMSCSVRINSTAAIRSSLRTTDLGAWNGKNSHFSSFARSICPAEITNKYWYDAK